MKHKIFFVSLLVLIITSSASVNAVDTTATPTPKRSGFWNIFRQEIREEHRENQDESKGIRVEIRQEIRQQGQEVKATATQTRLEAKKKRGQAYYDNIRKILVNRFENLLKIKTKIEARITAKEAEGKNLTEAKARLATFSDTKFKSDLADFDAKFKAYLDSVDPQKKLTEVRQVAEVLKTDLHNLRIILVDTLKLVIKAK